MTVRLPEELARRVTKAAEARQQSPEQVALEAIDAQIPADDAADALEAFIGSGSSGRGDLARHHREFLADASANKNARDV